LIAEFEYSFFLLFCDKKILSGVVNLSAAIFARMRRKKREYFTICWDLKLELN
jgi:hypothetical protein